MDVTKIKKDILSKLNNGNKDIKPADYGIDMNILWALCDEMQQAGLIEGVTVKKGGHPLTVLLVITLHANITSKGKSFLENR